MSPAVVATERETLLSYGWPVRTQWFWIYHGGRFHPYEYEWGVPLALTIDIVFAVVVIFGVLFLLDALLSMKRS